MPIMGDCPYEGCDHHEWRELPDAALPVMSRETCDGCDRIVWVRYSRVDPEVWTEEGFLNNFDVDAATKSIKRKPDASENA